MPSYLPNLIGVFADETPGTPGFVYSTDAVSRFHFPFELFVSQQGADGTISDLKFLAGVLNNVFLKLSDSGTPDAAELLAFTASYPVETRQPDGTYAANSLTFSFAPEPVDPDTVEAFHVTPGSQVAVLNWAPTSE